MKLPENTCLHVSDRHGRKIKDIIINMEVNAGTKNSYNIFFPKTNETGESVLSKSDFIGQFKDHHETGLMDYNGLIETANPVVEVSLFDTRWLNINKEFVLSWPLSTNEKLKWNSREEQYNYLISCINSKFKMKKIKINIESSNHIKLVLD